MRAALAAARERARSCSSSSAARRCDFLTSRARGARLRLGLPVVDARAFGLPQRRKRVLLLASRTRRPAPVLFADDAGEPPFAARAGVACGFYWTEGIRGLGWAVDAVPTLKGGSTIGIPSPPAIWLPDGGIVVARHPRRRAAAGIRRRLDVPADVTGPRRRRCAGSSSATPSAFPSPRGSESTCERRSSTTTRSMPGRRANASPLARRRLQRRRKSASGERLRMARARSIHTARGVPPAPDGGSLGACDGRLPRARAP